MSAAVVEAILASAALGAPDPVASQEQARRLEVRRKQIELQEARVRLRRVTELFDQGLVSRSELETAQSFQQLAQLNYQEAVLSLLNVPPRISVSDAVKYQSKDGRNYVRLTVRNATPSFDDAGFRLLDDFDGAAPVPDDLKTRAVHDLFVALRQLEGGAEEGGRTPQGTTIALPYEVHIPELRYGESRVLRFQLLRDASSVRVAATHQGEQQEIDLVLQQADGDSAVVLSSTQVSQEADLGSQANFDLQLERTTVDGRPFELRVLNLARPISYSFIDPETQARLSRIHLPSGVSGKALTLRLFLPERPDEEVRIDQPLAFWAVAFAPEDAAALGGNGTVAEAALEGSRAGRIRLEMIPRGVGRIEVSAASLFSEVQRGDDLRLELRVRNAGTRDLDNVHLEAEPPLDWRVELTPATLRRLAIDEQQVVELRVPLGDEVPVGDYEIRVRTEAFAYNRPVPTEDKIFRVSVKGRTDLLGNLILVLVLAAGVVAVVVLGIRLSRR